MEYKILLGSPAETNVWDQLLAFIKKDKGIRMMMATVDTGGHYTQEAYTFAKRCRKNGVPVYGIKGSKDPIAPVIPSRPKGKKGRERGRTDLFMVGVNTAKTTIHGRLKIENPGPGYMHFPMTYDEEYFKQLTAEKLSYDRRKRKRTWMLIYGRRNEALDIEVYNMAALGILKEFFNLDLDSWMDKMKGRPAAAKELETQRIKGRRVISKGIA